MVTSMGALHRRPIVNCVYAGMITNLSYDWVSSTRQDKPLLILGGNLDPSEERGRNFIRTSWERG